MPRKKISKNKLSKNFQKKKSPFEKKISMEELPFTTIKVTIHALRWIFLIIFIYIGVSIFMLFLQGESDQIQQIVAYSVAGFFTFFMGYYGWMFARNVMQIVSGKEPKQEEF